MEKESETVKNNASTPEKELQFEKRPRQLSYLGDSDKDAKRTGSDNSSKSENKHRNAKTSNSIMYLPDKKKIDFALNDNDPVLINIESELARSESWEEIESSVGDSFIHPDDLSVRKWIFFFFTMGNFWMAFDNGIIPACQIQMMEDLQISKREIAFLSSATNIGLALAALIVAPTLAVFKTKNVLVVAFSVNAFASGLFAVSSHYSTLNSARFLLGFTQAFCGIYAPIWINEFSPKAQSTRWMATNQAFCAIGIIFGYAIGALITDLPV